MRNIITALFVTCLTLSSCNTASPQEYFTQAVLNCNLLYGFAGYELKRDLATTSEKIIDEKTLATSPIKRTEVVKTKLEFIEGNFAKLKKLTVTSDTKEILKATTELYEYVLPVYKTEYMQLATLYDEGAAKEKIELAEKNINDKYEQRFLQLYNNVQLAGKAYAIKNGIEVREVNPIPPAL